MDDVPVEVPTPVTENVPASTMQGAELDHISQRLAVIEEKLNGLVSNQNLTLLLELLEEMNREDRAPSGGSKLYRPLFRRDED